MVCHHLSLVRPLTSMRLKETTRKVLEEDPGLSSSHRHDKCTATHRVIPSDRDSETRGVTPNHWMNEKISTQKQYKSGCEQLRGGGKGKRLAKGTNFQLIR